MKYSVKNSSSSMSGKIHHIDITVGDLDVSTRFYDFCLVTIGFKRIQAVDEGPLWAGEYVEFGLQLAKNRTLHNRDAPGLNHLAFDAVSPAAVDDLYRELCARGVTILDAPASYEKYTLGYYAVFFLDPDGIKLEYVYTPEWPV